MTYLSLPDDIRVFLPKFLSEADHKRLLSELGRFPETDFFYLPSNISAPKFLQADGWRGFLVADVVTGDRKTVSGVILSNSCDIDPENERTLIPRIIFSPLISVPAYQRLLANKGMSAPRIESQLQSIRAQAVTNIFHLPAKPYGPEESIILLDGIHVQPMPLFIESNRSRLFRLTQVSFYAFLLKLSIHFTRMQEGVSRFPQPETS